MSLKVNTFASIITNPLNIHKFVVSIPDASVSSIVVASSSFPSEKLQEVVLHYQGEEIVYPTIPKQDHSWKISVPENDSGSIRRELDKLKTKMWNQQTGIFLPSTWSSVEVTARDLSENPVFKVRLIGAWLVGRDSVSLSNDDATKNWNWDYEFRYQYIIDVDSDNIGSAKPL